MTQAPVWTKGHTYHLDGPLETAANTSEELDRLRAEVASLKEELAATQSVGLRYARENHDLTQQLAAANGRVERMLGIAERLAKLAQHADDCLWATPLPTGIGHWHCTCGKDELVLDGELLDIAALSDLPQQVKSEDARGERAKADRDAMLYGQGFMVGGKHVPLQDILIIPPAISAQENKS